VACSQICSLLNASGLPLLIRSQISGPRVVLAGRPAAKRTVLALRNHSTHPACHADRQRRPTCSPPPLSAGAQAPARGARAHRYEAMQHPLHAHACRCPRDVKAWGHAAMQRPLCMRARLCAGQCPSTVCTRKRWWACAPPGPSRPVAHRRAVPCLGRAKRMGVHACMCMWVCKCCTLVCARACA